MKTFMRMACAALALALGTAAYAEDFEFLKAKVALLVDQAKDMYEDSCRRGSASYGAANQYYFGLIHASGKVLLDRKESTATTLRMRKFVELAEKDYEAYTRIEAAAGKAAATGHDRVVVSRNRIALDGGRHRAKRIANVDKLRDKELGAAVVRWEKFASQLKRDKK